MESPIKLRNGARALRFTLRFDQPGTRPHGVVLAQWGDEYVVWSAYFTGEDDLWSTERGEYTMMTEGDDAMRIAIDKYNARRAGL